MSVEKLLDASKTEIEENPYAQICNSVTEYIKDNDAFRLYCYLASKSRNWVVIKDWTNNFCRIGKRKSKQCWSYLERCGLIEYIFIRNDKGKFIKQDIKILNGTKFNPEVPFLVSTGAETAPLDNKNESYPQVENSTDINQQVSPPIHRCNNPPGGETARAVLYPLLNKDNTNKDFDKKKSFCSNEQKKSKSDWKAENEKQHDFAEAMNNAAQSQKQMEREAKHIEESESFKYVGMPDSLRSYVKRGYRQ
jgi:hypothetical protein